MLPVFLIGGLGVQLQDDLGMTTAGLGAVVAVYWAVSALLSTTGGYVERKLGTRRGMLLSVAFGLASLLGTALASPHWAWLFLWLSVAGAANALGHPLANSLIANQVGRAHRALAFGFKQAAIPAATLAAGLSVPALALTIGWRWAFALAAVFAVLLLPALVLTVPKRRPMSTIKSQGKTREPLPRPLKSFLLATAIAGGMGSAQANVLGAFTVVSALNAGFDAASAGLLLALGSAAGCLARPLVGLAADSGIGGSMATVAMMMAIGSAGLLGMASGNTIAFAVGCVLAFGFGWGWNGLVHYIVSRRSHPFIAHATGITQRGTYIGGTLGPLVFGFIFASFGPAVGWTLAASIAVMGAIAALIAYRMEKTLPTLLKPRLAQYR
ncbi:MFS transporter [Arthrobacter pigmenti]